MKKETPKIKTIELLYKDKAFTVEYFLREGLKETILFIHGPGGSKENYWESWKSDSLAEHTLISFDSPGTGNSTYYDELRPGVDDLAAITSLFIKQLNITEFILWGTNTSRLTTLLSSKEGGLAKVKAYITMEGNLMPEDCMFSKEFYDVIGKYVDDLN